MCTTTAKEIMPEELSVYTDLSQQFVPFEESDESATSPVTVKENEADKQPRNFCDEAVKQSPSSDYNSNVIGHEAPEEPEMLKEFKMADEKPRASAQKTKNFRKRNTRQGGGNGLCPPHPPEDVPIVNWSEPHEIKHIFPKTHNYVVYAQARYSSQYLNLSKWRKEFDFFLDKYKYWCDIIQKKQLGNHKEVTKAKQLVGQLRWLLDHCWEGDESKPLVPEMLWRARKEETRRCEQLLIRKEYYKREVLVKTATPSLSRRANASMQKVVGRYDSDRSCSLKNNIKKPTFMFQRKITEQTETDGSVTGLQKMPLSNKIKKEEDEQEDNSLNLWKERDQIIKKRAHLFSLQFLVRRWADVLKQLQTPTGIMRSLSYCTIVRNHLEKYVRDLISAYEKINDSDDLNEQMIHVLLRRDMLLKQEMRNSGLESLINNWIIFESKAEQVACDLSKLKNTMELTATRNSGARIPGRSALTTKTEIPRPVAIKPSNLTEDEKNRLELQEVVAVEALWAAFAKTETPKFKDDKPLLDAIETVLSSCRNYRAVLEIPLPKTLADLRRCMKFRNIHEAVALLQALIIQRHEAKTGRRVDLTLFETPEIRRLRAQCAATAAVHNSNPTVSLKPAEVASQLSTSTGVKPSRNDIKLEQDEMLSKKEQKQLVEGTIESGKEEELEREIKPEKNDGSIEILAAKRPKRQIKAPQRFIFDDEEKEEEKKKKAVSSTRTKIAKGSNSKTGDKLKETSQHGSGRKRKREKKADSSASSMEFSNMETIVVIPEDDGVNVNDHNYWSSNNDEMLLGLDLVDVTTEHEFKCESDGTVHDVFRYVATWKNGTSKEVSRRVYELWTNRKTAEESEQAATKKSKIKDLSIIKGAESIAEQQRTTLPEITQHKQISSINFMTDLDYIGNSKERMINHDHTSSVFSNDSINRFSITGPCSSQNIISGDISGKQNEDGDCGPWRQVAFRKEASLGGPAKMDKLKTQYDHLLMISEKSYVGKLYSEWMYVPEGGPFDDRVKRIRQLVQELEDVLNQPSSTWRDYFNMKKYLQTLIDNIMVDFSALCGQAELTHLLPTSNITFSSSRSTMSDVERVNADVSIRPNSN
ncbi:Acetyl-coenzyme A synthetase [Dirofilaria immitis]